MNYYYTKQQIAEANDNKVNAVSKLSSDISLEAGNL